MQRWIHADKEDPREALRVQETMAQIELWWAAFAAKHAAISDLFAQRIGPWDLSGWMTDNLHEISPHLMWEYGPALNGDGHRLVITPEYRRYLRPLVETILERAPEIDGWEFYAYRMAESLEQAALTVEGRTSGDISDLKVCVHPADDGLLDLVFVSPRAEGIEAQNARRNEAFVTAETLLGEENLDRWIGAIDVVPEPEADAADLEVISLAELAESVDRHLDKWLDALPEKPCVDWIDNETDWSCWEINHRDRQNDDGNGNEESDQSSQSPHDPMLRDFSKRHDMFVVVSGYGKLTNAIFNGRSIYSDVFTRTGETFCYLKIDGADGLDEERFKDRNEIEDALNNALKPEGIGCVIGGGTGHRYSYIDLALMSVPIGIDVIKRVLRMGKIPTRTWLLFFDSRLEAEWVGIYYDTPPPPSDDQD